MRIAYEDWRPNASTMAVVAHANSIATDYARQGYNLTLRQLYYRFVAADLIENSDRSYKRLGSIVNRGRLAGLLDWDHIEDRTRNLLAWETWVDPESIVSETADNYKEDLWADQPTQVEVWVEKDALIDVVGRAAGKHDTPHFSCRGYVSQSEMWRAGQRIKRRARNNGQSTLILHLGDHDPSGIDMTRDIDDRLWTFSEGYADLEVRRIALTMDQITEYGPPPNPAKLSDSRSRDYVANYGHESWELDALEPSVLNTLIEEQTVGAIDWDLWEAAYESQEANRDKIREAISTF
jgi:hypothetical protein